MILVFDIGNTNIKVGLFDGEQLIESKRLASNSTKTGDEYWLQMRDMFTGKNINPNDISGVIMASVNPNINYTIENMVLYYLQQKPLVVGSGCKCGLNIKYDNPKEVGADRIVGCAAAYYTYGGPCVVVDCGTATTFNVVTEKGEFVGGPIAFGLKSSSDALSKQAAKLPKIELNFPQKVVGKNTIANMQSGILYGYIGMVEYLLTKIKAEMGDCKVIATGGISEIVGKHSSMIDKFDRTLTLRGLNIIYNLNRKP
ncbi:MAG: type III pantothenate kinase [Firmicutes bacterium]|nr:type III pantothenate kinase [Bacillota bacterium]